MARRWPLMCGLLLATCTSLTASPSAATEDPQSITCSVPGTSAVVQLPACDQFSKLDGSLGYDPLSYKTNTPNSLIAVRGLTNLASVQLQTLTPSSCVDPKVMTDYNWIDQSLTYISFTTASKGMCRISVSAEGLTSVAVLEMPVASWPVSVVRNPEITGVYDSSSTIQVGQSRKLRTPKFTYIRSRFDFATIAPLYIENLSPDVCSVSEDLNVTAVGAGTCSVKIGWPAFAFASRTFNEGWASFRLFEVKTKAQLSADKSAAAATAAATSARAKANAKLCPAASQQKLRSTYFPLSQVSKEISGYRQLLSRAQTLASMGGAKTIQIPPSQFAEVLSGYPVLGGTREVPLSTYIAVLRGAIDGASARYQRALATANSAYKSATAGCKTVVGPPQ